MGECCPVRGLALWAMGAWSNSSLLVIVGLGKVTGEGTFTEETGDGEDVFEEMSTGGGGIEAAAGRGEGVFGAETGGVRFLLGDVIEKFIS